MSKDRATALDLGRVAELEAALGRDARDRLLRMTADHARRGPELIASAAAESSDLVRREAHALRGAMQAVGADRLAAALEAVELGPPLTPGDARLPALADAAEEAAAAAERLLG